jgi:uncharacterized membrane protein (DUF4010 family)
MDFQSWQPYLISAAVGLLVGVEREKAHPKGEALGVRTFLLIAMLGSLAGGLSNIWIASALVIFTLCLIVVGYFYTSRGIGADQGLTTEFAAGIVFTLSFVSHTNPIITTLLGPIVAVVLFSKASLHRFTSRIKTSELQAALLLLLAATTVVHLLSDRVIDPWGIFNPRRFGLLVLILGLLQFSGYVATKLLGEKKSGLLLGLLGGLVSSTAVMLSSARDGKNLKPGSYAPYLSAVGSQISSLGQLLFIVAWVSPDLLIQLAVPVGASILAALVVMLILAWSGGDAKTAMALRSPLDWREVLRLALVFAGMLAGVAVANRYLGESGSYVVSFLAGLFELHGITLANATMFAQQHISREGVMLNTLLAITASLAAKTTICWMIARNRFAYIMTAFFALLGMVLWAAYFIGAGL